MKPNPGLKPRRKSGRREGVALIIVLAFVVILTGVVVAYFSRALNNRQISNSSASQTKVALFAQGASDAIIADIQAEIQIGSTPVSPSQNSANIQPPPTSGTFYVSSTTANSTPLMLPQMSGTNLISGVQSWAPNFLIRSAYGQPFYSGANGNSFSIPSNAVQVSSTFPSLNGRSISLARWNSHYLLPLLTGSDSTPISSGTGAFLAPDWVLVARDGSNSTVPSTNNPAVSGATWSGTNTSTVIGRYAYAIYHEGGLLDANVAGFPSTSNSNSQTSYKTGLSYADLTVLPGMPSNQKEAQQIVDQLIAWRNAASANPTYSYNNPSPFGFAPASSGGSNYYNFTISNPSGFLQVSSTSLQGASIGSSGTGSTDRMFSSRQELIAFVKNGLGLSGTALNILNYLATFTRGLDQPSYTPDPGRPLVVGSYLNGGNNVIPIANGPSYEIKDGSGNNDPINPSFLTVRVQGQFTRNDGTTANVGDPLVKTRFPLSRLAWITYLGPSGPRASSMPQGNPGPNNINYDLWQLVNKYGVSPTYLAQGTAANIYKNFGLVWAFDPVPTPSGGRGSVGQSSAASYHDGTWKWFYAGHNTPSGGTPGTVTVTNSNGAISRLGAIASLGSQARDPDFFELLKASVSAGSIAKSSMNLTTVGGDSSSGYGLSHPYYWQGKMDTNLDYAIIQLGANIIDQAKVDGYSTRIVFNDGQSGDNINGNPPEFRGVENLPYLYRTNSATMKLRMASPDDLTKLGGAAGAGNSVETKALQDPGVAMIMEIPTIWNPYDANAPLGDPAPAGSNTLVGGSSNFRIIADSTDPDYLAPSTTSTGAAITTYNYTSFNADGYDTNQLSSNAGGNASTEGLWTTGTNGSGVPIKPNLTLTPSYLIPLVPSNTQMTFQVPYAPMFREPTVLAFAGCPQNSNLELTGTPSVMVQNPTLMNSKGNPVYTQGLGFLSDGVNPMNLPAGANATTRYIGICAALYPVEFAVGGITATGVIHRDDYANLLVYGGLGQWFTYRLQYQSPNPQDAGAWITYDEKYTQFSTQFLDTPFGTNPGNLVDQSDGAPGGDWQSYADPRTGRFSAINGRDLENPVSTPAGTAQNVSSQGPGGFVDPAEWADPSLTDGIGPVEVTDRPDTNGGYPISVDRTTSGGIEWLALSSSGWTLTTAGNGHFRTGMLEQNSPNIYDNGIRFTGDTNNTVGDGPQYTYYSDPDGVVRGAMGVYQPPGPTVPATDTMGLPLATAYTGTNSFRVNSSQYQAQSRPYFLHRPYRSVGELGYVFSGTPWKNIDFFTPQSGDVALLDVFSAFEPPAPTPNPNPLVAGVVDLNTRQAPVLAAILAGAYADEVNSSGTGTASVSTPFYPFNSTTAYELVDPPPNATGTNPPLIQRTSSSTTGQGQLQNVGDLVGRWFKALSSQNKLYTGFSGPSGDLSGLYSYALANSSSSLTQTEQEEMEYIDRFRESYIRPLASAGNTRVWNLLIDLVAQTGRYPTGTTNPANFVVDGEQRYWIHVAIDRFTGQVLDKQVEVVKE